MLFLVLFTTTVLAIVAVVVWPAFRSTEKAETVTPGAGGAGGAAPLVPTTLEGALAGQLLRGDINRRQYQSGLERLAARDDQEHPLSVPEKGDFSR